MPEKVGRDSARKRSKAIIKVRKTVLLIVNSDNIDITLQCIVCQGSRIFELTWRQPDHLLQELVWGVEEHRVGRDQVDQQQNLEEKVFFLEIILVGQNHLVRIEGVAVSTKFDHLLLASIYQR